MTAQIDILQQSNDDLIQYLNTLCEIDLPISIETVDDLKTAAGILGKLGPLYSFLVNMKLRTNIQKRMFKKNKEQEKYEDFLIKENIFEAFIDQVKMMYNTTSRMVTLKQLVNEELKYTKLY